MRKHPGGLFQLTLALAPKDAHLGLPGRRRRTRDLDDPEPTNQEDGDSEQSRRTGTTTRTTTTTTTATRDWNERDDPCKASYYRYAAEHRAARNLLASNIGLIAKRGAEGQTADRRDGARFRQAAWPA